MSRWDLRSIATSKFYMGGPTYLEVTAQFAVIVIAIVLVLRWVI